MIGIVFIVRNRAQHSKNYLYASKTCPIRIIFSNLVTYLNHPVDVDIISKCDVIFNILNMVIRNLIKQI